MRCTQVTTDPGALNICHPAPNHHVRVHLTGAGRFLLGAILIPEFCTVKYLVSMAGEGGRIPWLQPGTKRNVSSGRSLFHGKHVRFVRETNRKLTKGLCCPWKPGKFDKPPILVTFISATSKLETSGASFSFCDWVGSHKSHKESQLYFGRMPCSSKDLVFLLLLISPILVASPCTYLAPHDFFCNR